MDLQLRDHVAVVMGGARGIGLAIAREFASEGCRVALVDRSPDVENVARGLGASARGVRADATDYAAVRAAADAIVSDLGGVDHLVYAVGIGSGQFGFPFWDVDPAVWPRVLDVNVVSAVYTMHAFAPKLIARGGGTALLVSSVAGQIGSQTDPPYSASKAALINFAQCAARDLAKYDVRVNTLCPGMVKTDLNRAVWQSWADKQPPAERLSYEAWTDDKIRRVVPLARWQEPEDMAAMAVFLASARARNICGQTVNVDGGFVMHW